MLPSDLHVLTGAPGSGKSAILDDLQGVQTFREPAREVLAVHRATTPGPEAPDPVRFTELLLARSIQKHASAIGTDAPVAVFDRGIPDCIAYAALRGADLGPSMAAAARYRYHREALLFEPWREIYHTDDERTMSFEDTLPFHGALVDAYERSGYVLIRVPRGSIAERTSFVRETIGL